MDVDKLQKINALASMLRKHNFASSSEDAFQQAERTFDDDSAEQTVVEQKSSIEHNDALIMRKCELMLELNNKKHSQEIDLLRSAITRLAENVDSIRSTISKMNEVSPVPKEKQKVLKTETKEAHPRQGDFKPDDVDIQKMFYFGKK